MDIARRARSADSHIGFICENDEKDFVLRALQCRNGIGLADGGLRHDGIVEVL